MQEFMKQTQQLRNNSVVCYPMMSNQVDFAGDIAHFGFKFVGLAVLRFLFDNEESKLIFDNNTPHHLGYQIRVGAWKDSYKKDAIKIIHENFKNTSDALFDKRFNTYGFYTFIYKGMTFRTLYRNIQKLILKAFLRKEG